MNTKISDQYFIYIILNIYNENCNLIFLKFFLEFTKDFYSFKKYIRMS